MVTTTLVISIVLVVLLTIDIILTIKKLYDITKLLRFIENGEVSYIRAVKEIAELNGIKLEDVEKETTQRRGKAVPWSERNRESQSR